MDLFDGKWTGITGSFNQSKGSSASNDVTNIEARVSAGSAARVTTPDALIIRGGQLSG